MIVVSTDYRDLRKAAYQEYVVALDYNIIRLPPKWTYEEGSSLGVAFVAAALTLGISFGADFSTVLGGPDLFALIRSVEASEIPTDVIQESLHGVQKHERLKRGDWLAIWGGEYSWGVTFLFYERIVD